MNESRNKAFEQMEMTALELQKANQKLQSETTTMKKRYKDLAEMVESMDLRCEDYRKEIEDLQKERVRLQRDLSMALSIREESDTSDSEVTPGIRIQKPNTMTEELRVENEKELEALNVKISKLKEQHSLERKKREELEYELSELIHENQNLESQLRTFAEHAEEWQQVVSESTTGERVADILPTTTRIDSTEDLVDDDSFVVVTEQLSRQSSAVSDHSGVIVLSPSEEKPETMSQNSASFFSELGDQYHELVRKYDALLDKCKIEGLGKNLPPIPMVQRAVQVSPLPSPLEPRPRSFTDGDLKKDGTKTSEYKKMFEHIYERLEESKNFRPGTP